METKGQSMEEKQKNGKERNLIGRYEQKKQ